MSNRNVMPSRPAVPGGPERLARPAAPGRPPAGKGLRVFPLLFFLAGSVLLILGLGSLGAGFLARGEALPDGFAWQAPLDQVNNHDLAPATVLMPLTGVTAADVLNSTLDGGHWENAYALLAYDTTLPDPTRIGIYLQLGSRYAAGKEKDKAAWCYLDAYRIAIISPLVSDAIREDTLFQVAAGLRALGASDAARLVTDQAYLVAQYSTALKQDQQPRRLAQAANAYEALGVQKLADQARDKSSEPMALPTDEAGYLPREPFIVTVGKLPESSEVNGAVETRIAAAKQLSEDLRQVPANREADWPQDSVGQLRSALLQEDTARLAFYEGQLASTKDQPVQIALVRDQVNWLGLKYRAARGAFGTNLVPEWSKTSPAIAKAWSDAWQELFRLVQEQARAIPNAQAVSQAMEDVTREQLLALRWGWYRGESDEDLHSRLSELTRQLRDASIPSLRLDMLAIQGKRTDVLLPDELYGKNEQALPR